MCLSVPGQIISLVEGEPGTQVDTPGVRAMVDVSGVQRMIDVGLLAPDDVGPGDWVLIHLGYALSKIDADEARATLELLAQLPQPDAPGTRTP